MTFERFSDHDVRRLIDHDFNAVTWSRDRIGDYVDRLEHALTMSAEATAPASAVANLAAAFGLSPTGARLLAMLADGRTWTKEKIHDTLYASRPDDPPEAKIIDVLVCKMRQKVAPFGVVIGTVWGVGYRIIEGGEVLVSCAAGAVPPHSPVGHVCPPSRPPGTRPTVAYGTAQSAFVRWLSEQPRDAKGHVRFAARDFPNPTYSQTSTLIRNCERAGYIRVVRAPVSKGRRGIPATWTVTFTEKAASVIDREGVAA